MKQTPDSFTVEQTFLESIYVRLLPVPPCTTIDPKPDCPCCLAVGQLAGLSEFFLTKPHPLLLEQPITDRETVT